MIIIITILGSLASIICAVWAFLEAKKASNSASQAENVKNELINRRKLVEISKISSQTDTILLLVSKIGPSSDPKMFRGIDLREIINKLEIYSQFLNSQSLSFEYNFKTKSKDLCKEINSGIEKLSRTKKTNEIEIKEIGEKIYNKIYLFVPYLNQIEKSKQDF